MFESVLELRHVHAELRQVNPYSVSVMLSGVSEHVWMRRTNSLHLVNC